MTPTSPLAGPIPFITLPNWVKAAAQCGFNIQPIFEQLGIDTDLNRLEDATITPPQLGQAMEACVAQSKSQHFPFVLGETFAFDYLPDLDTFLTTSPTLREAARVFTWVRELINPLIDIALEESGDTASLVMRGPDGAPAVTPQDRYFVESIFASVAKFGRALAGEQVDRHARLRFRHAPPSYAEAYERYFRVPVLFSQAANALDLPRALMDQRLEGGFPRLHEQAEQRVGQRLARVNRRGGLIAAIDSAFERDPRLLGQGIERLAQRLDLHPRTLQRRLRDEGQAFGELQDRVRYRLALNALQDPALDLETISERLGFSDRRSFTRAFTRWAGVSPSEYRRKQAP